MVSGLKRLGALDARLLAWLGFAHDILGLPRQAVRWEADALAAAAQGLAACRPYAVRLDDVSVQVRVLLNMYTVTNNIRRMREGLLGGDL